MKISEGPYGLYDVDLYEAPYAVGPITDVRAGRVGQTSDTFFLVFDGCGGIVAKAKVREDGDLKAAQQWLLDMVCVRLGI